MQLVEGNLGAEQNIKPGGQFRCVEVIWLSVFHWGGGGGGQNFLNLHFFITFLKILGGGGGGFQGTPTPLYEEC